jgi:hypothetical protein
MVAACGGQCILFLIFTDTTFVALLALGLFALRD